MYHSIVFIKNNLFSQCLITEHYIHNMNTYLIIYILIVIIYVSGNVPDTNCNTSYDTNRLNPCPILTVTPRTIQTGRTSAPSDNILR